MAHDGDFSDAHKSDRRCHRLEGADKAANHRLAVDDQDVKHLCAHCVSVEANRGRGGVGGKDLYTLLRQFLHLSHDELAKDRDAVRVPQFLRVNEIDVKDRAP